MQNRKDEQILKVIIIGDCGVGKSNLLIRYCQDKFKPSYVATIGVDFRIKTITIKDKRIKLQIWDTAGQERYKNMTQAYYKNAAAIIMIYSITEARSYQSIEKWMDQVNQHAPSDVIKMLIGNKLDMQSLRAVHERQGQALANKYSMPFMQVSAMSGVNVVEMFAKLGQMLVDDYLPNQKQLKTRYSLTSQAYSIIQNKQKKCQC